MKYLLDLCLLPLVPLWLLQLSIQSTSVNQEATLCPPIGWAENTKLKNDNDIIMAFNYECSFCLGAALRIFSDLHYLLYSPPATRRWGDQMYSEHLYFTYSAQSSTGSPWIARSFQKLGGIYNTSSNHTALPLPSCHPVKTYSPPLFTFQ